MTVKSNVSFAGFVHGKVEELRAAGRDGTADTYLSAQRSFLKFRGGKDFEFDVLTCSEVSMYESWLLRRGVSRNTSSFYLRTLRTICRLAERAGLETGGAKPFSDVYTGFSKTVKRAVSIAEIRRIKALDLTGRPALDLARDLFLFSFYMRGMPFVDLAYLKKSDLRGGSVVYARRKTGQCLAVEWESQMQAVADKYAESVKNSIYMLPVITRTDIPERIQYQDVQHSVNRNLKVVAALAGMDTPLSFYVARHTWASAAYRMNIPVSVISESMGHESERTTRIYLASLDSSVVDSANRRILSCLQL